MEEMIDYFTEEVNILDGQITKIEIFTQDGFPAINVFVKLRYPLGKYFKMSFLRVRNFAFNWDLKDSFYNISFYKWIKKDDFYYVSFDPDEKYEHFSQTDNDCILSESFIGFFSEDDVSYQEFLQMGD